MEHREIGWSRRGPTRRTRAAPGSLRPASLATFVGQGRLKERLAIAVGAAQERDEPLEHVLFHGPPGLGKTTLAHIIADEMGGKLITTSGPALEKTADLMGILTNLQTGDVLFVDEIHRMPRAIEEYLYPAMEDFAVDFVLDKGPFAKAIRLAAQALHAGRRDDARGPARVAAARPLRAATSTWTSTARPSSRRSSRRSAGLLGVEHRAGGGRRDRPPLARHAPHRQPTAAAGARLRPGQGRTATVDAGRCRRPRWSWRASTTRAWTSWTARCWTAIIRALRRRAGRDRGAGRDAAGGDRHAHRRGRAVPAPARLPDPDLGRPASDRPLLPAPRGRAPPHDAVAISRRCSNCVSPAPICSKAANIIWYDRNAPTSS